MCVCVCVCVCVCTCVTVLVGVGVCMCLPQTHCVEAKFMLKIGIFNSVKADV